MQPLEKEWEKFFAKIAKLKTAEKWLSRLAFLVSVLVGLLGIGLLLFFSSLGQQ